MVPSNNSVLEPEFWSRVPPGVAFYATRLPARGNLTVEAVRRMETEVDRAVDLLVATGVSLLAYADMVTTFVMDDGWNQATTTAIAHRAGVPCLTAWTALESALNALSVRRLAVGTPYPHPIHALVRPFLERRGFTVTGEGTLDVLGMADVPRLSMERVRALAAGLERTDADAVVLLATDLPTFDVISSLEAELAIPVLTSNQTLLWDSLKRGGVSADVVGLGRLFRS
jgi:maleate cis-trans isomerase